MASPGATPVIEPVSDGFGASSTLTLSSAFTVSAALPIANVCVTSGAGAYRASPGCEAVMLHDPAAVMWTSAPAIVHWPDAANDTARPELAVAVTVKSGAP